MRERERERAETVKGLYNFCSTVQSELTATKHLEMEMDPTDTEKIETGGEVSRLKLSLQLSRL
jgi:hypothetical protein